MMPRRGGLLERVCREEWNLAIVYQTADDIVQRGIVGIIRWFPPAETVVWAGRSGVLYHP